MAMAKKKVVRHMGMTMTEEEHRKWHEQHKGAELTPQEHAKLMRRLGVGKDTDRKWHKAQASPGKDAPPGAASDDEKPASVLAIGGGFLAYCVKQSWLVQRGRGRAAKYFATDAGREALAEFGITKY
jgi:hypothetical protein